MENSGKMENMAENGRETVVANGRVTVEVNGKDARRTMEVDGKEVAEKNENETNHERGKDTSIEECKINYRGWKAMPFIIGNETFEKLGAIGTLANLLVYLTTVFNMENVTAATIITVFNGTCNFGTFIGAYLSDAYFGRYKTLGFATVTSFLGLLVIDLTAAIPQLHPPQCGKESVPCEGPTPGQLAFLFTGFVLMVIGAGGVRPCNLAFGADQFDPKTESGKRGIASFIKWYFFTFTFAQLVSVTLIVYVQSSVGWAIGLGIPPALMLIACVVYFAGTKIYVKVKATGSPLTSVAQVIVAAIKKRRLKPVEQPWLSLFNYIPPESINAKLSYTDQFRLTGKEQGITMLQRIGFGIILSILSMIISGIVEDWRRAMALTKPTLGTVPRKGAISSMSGLWLVPQLVLAGIAEAFGSVGLTEFYYKQFPENMRSIAASLFYCGMAASSYICSLLITIVHRTTGVPRNWLPEDLNKGRLDYFYYMIAAMGILDLGYFLLCAKWYRYKEGNSDTPDVNEVDHIAEK